MRHSRALNLIENLTDGVLLWQVAAEFIGASRKLDKFGFTADEAWRRLSEFRELFHWSCRPSAVPDNARLFHIRDRLAFWDAMIVAACFDCGATLLYSEDLPGKTSFASLRIVDPFV